jgi:hypothetical protein
MAILYRHIRLDKKEVFYIGIGSNENRAYSLKNRNKYWQNVANSTEYKVEIMFEDLSWEEACEKEIEFISTYGRKDLGLGTLVNMTDGGEGNLNLSEESKQRRRDKVSKANLGRVSKKKGIPNIKSTGINSVQAKFYKVENLVTGEITYHAGQTQAAKYFNVKPNTFQEYPKYKNPVKRKDGSILVVKEISREDYNSTIYIK